jgi:hypothetical protein
MSNLSLFPPASPRRRPIRLHSAGDARRFLSKLINGVFRNEIDSGTAARLGYLAGILLKTIETSDIEQRLVDLEKRLAERG